MLTPQEIKEKTFIRAVIGGYDMTSVDDFLLPLSEDYAALYKENSILKGKLKVLVETVEEYRSVDEAMRKALLTAQKMASATLDEAKEKSRVLMDEAEEKAREKIEGLRDEIMAEQKRLELARAQTAKFIAESIALHKSQIELLGQVPDMEIPPESQKLAAMNIRKAAEEIDQNLNAKFSGEFHPDADMEAAQKVGPETAETQAAEASDAAASEAPFEIDGIELPEADNIESVSITDFNSGASASVESDLKMKVFEFTIGEKSKLDDEITAELPVFDDDDIEDSDPPPRYNFDNLQFGKDFSLKK